MLKTRLLIASPFTIHQKPPVFKYETLRDKESKVAHKGGSKLRYTLQRLHSGWGREVTRPCCSKYRPRQPVHSQFPLILSTPCQ